MRYLSAGFSHGKGYSAILDGFPAKVFIDEGKILAALRLRQSGYGRSERQAIADEIEFTAGLIGGESTGAPIAFFIPNHHRERLSFFTPRPSHADLNGAVKFGYKDISYVSERASGRESVVTVAIGEICASVLHPLGVGFFMRILSVGGVQNTDTPKCFDKNEIFICDEIKRAIDKAKTDGDALGGRGEVIISGLPAGLGTFTSLDGRLDAILARAVLSIPSVKSAEIGLARELESMSATESVDNFTVENGTIGRKSNNMGGIEGGMSSGEDIVIRFSIKPPPANSAAQSYNLNTLQQEKPPQMRSDVCAAEAVTAAVAGALKFEILNAILSETAGNTITEVAERYKKLKQRNTIG